MNYHNTRLLHSAMMLLVFPSTSDIRLSLHAQDVNLLGHQDDTYVPDETQFGDTILVNGTFYTQVEKMPTVDACAISDGRFVWLGDRASVEKLKTKRTRGASTCKGAPACRD
ncbi:MAG: hypothetical protein AAF483_04180 [Planctomycetota bacterium]